ncbi:DUF4337 domain-containing protein [Lampropedia aestuarii]|uniref:DUF4337 domain-containing protein n=1 Tax=Lampropedia aestuarii TaxID=2562762 RepID=A0A4S5BY04_9BURK|nr:DUF4337 domain-containing protein [Lampropedia aestuarii]THJ36191.1 DUF4337 domain-containing protein [Lampropedia aestuarii]
MLSEISLALTAITGAKTITEGLVAERDAVKIRTATSELLGLLIDVQGTLLALQRDQAVLNEELARHKKEKSELADRLKRVERTRQEYTDYERVLVAGGHCVVYAAKPDEHRVRHPPYLCATCFEADQYSTLSLQMGTQKKPGRKLVCPASALHTLALPRGSWTPENLCPVEKSVQP